MNIVDVIRSENCDRQDKIALVSSEGECTYGDLFDATTRVRTELHRLGIRQFDRICLQHEDNIDYVAVALGILAAGAVLAPIDPLSSGDEAVNVQDRINSNCLISDKPLSAEKQCQRIQGVLPSGSDLWVSSREAEGQSPSGYEACNPAFIRFSSGTTGDRKGVVLSHEAIVERTDAAQCSLQITTDDRIAFSLSMSHHFVVSTLLFLRRGAQIIICRDEKDMLSLLPRYLPTFIYASPSQYESLCDSSGFGPAALSQVRLALSTAISARVDLMQSFERKFGKPLCQAYGIIEIGLPFIQLPADGTPPGSVGRVGSSYSMRLENVDENGVGEILIKGEGMFSGYFNPWQTRSNVCTDGWFRTGDLGRLEDDSLFIAGRKKSVINFAGMKFFPNEVEVVLNSHPMVAESVVFGRPCEQHGQIPAARLVPSNGGTLDEGELQRFCSKALADYKVPKSFEVVEQLPRTATGKIRRV